MKNIVIFSLIALAVVAPPASVKAQIGTNFCDQSTAISSNSGSTTIGVARGYEVVSVCGYHITGTTAGTTMRFASSTTNLTGTMTIAQWGNIGMKADTPVLYGLPGQTVTANCGTGQCFGWVNWGQR